MQLKKDAIGALPGTIDDVWRHIGSLVTTIESRECGNYFANAGYASVKM